ncbi:hypothetical protein Ddye_000581 [Dipteronia dyeriana]|uniref:Uncharacterized protein n=1 Tax=Dipteronia dyeriana TaxID=168575 RepID=A0AAE0CSN8_9ROSI|nr:hypothetical protein Ddye_000581 [Dipteronia dyeriana]
MNWGPKDTMSWLLVQCGEHWKGNRLTGHISFSLRLTKKDNGAYDELLERIYHLTWVSRDNVELKLTLHVKMGVDTVTLSIMSDDDVEFMVIHREKGDEGPLYKGQMFKDKTTLNQAVGSYAFAKRFEHMISGSSNTRFTAEYTQRSYGWVLRAWKSNRRTYWHVKVFVNEHTCKRYDNYNVEFKRVRAAVIGDLFANKYRDPERTIRPKDIVSEMRE